MIVNNEGNLGVFHVLLGKVKNSNCGFKTKVEKKSNNYTSNYTNYTGHGQANNNGQTRVELKFLNETHSVLQLVILSFHKFLPFSLTNLANLSCNTGKIL